MHARFGAFILKLPQCCVAEVLIGDDLNAHTERAKSNNTPKRADPGLTPLFTKPQRPLQKRCDIVYFRFLFSYHVVI